MPSHARMLCVLLSVMLTAVAPGRAGAGAWTLAAGDGLLITTSGRKTAPAGALFRGLPEHDVSSLHIFMEYGLTDRLTVGMKASGELVATTAQVDLRLGGHARYRLWRGEKGDVFSVQAGGSMPVEGWVGDPLAGGTAGNVPEGQFGLLYGRGWVSDWGNSFATVEAAVRWRGGEEADELRLEATAGHAVSRRLMGLFGVYAAMPLGRGQGSLKLAPSIAWTMWPSLGPNEKKPAEFPHPRTVQFGITHDLLNPGDGLAVDISIWQRF